MRRLLSLCVGLVVCSIVAQAQRTDLSGLVFCIDPGHGGYESDDRHVIPDPGTDFWESESNFQKALHLKPLLEQQGATVYLTRSGNSHPDLDDPSLTARWQLANSVNADWFHSIHSNAYNGTVNYTIVLIKENISTRQPAFPQAVTMSNYVYNHIRAKLRTGSSAGNIAPGVYLDYTFYGGPGVGYNLGVLSGLVMPGQLSEGSFHDYYPETRRLMNNDYRKMEAYALRNAFMQYFGVPSDTLGTIAGVQSERGTGKLVNYSRVRLLPVDRMYNGDRFNNGFYMFDSLAPGQYTVRFETPGFFADSAVVSVGTGATVFLDRQLESTTAPTILSSVPANNDTAFSANGSIIIRFTKVMDTASVRSAFSIVPSVAGTIRWSDNNTLFTFDPDSVVLPFDTYFTVTIDSSARSASGLQLDANGDGTPGDPFILSFKTKPVDAWPPVLISVFPDSVRTVGAPNHVINMTFDEPLNPSTVNSTNFAIRIVGGLVLSKTLEYWESNGKSGVNMYVPGGLTPGKSYLVRISGVTDLSGNPIPTAAPIVWQFTVGPQTYITTTIDDFNADPTANWWQPSSSGSTTGISSASFQADATKKYSFVPTSTASAKLTYAWNTSASAWLIREYLNTGTPRSVTWTKRLTRLQAYVWGDGSGTLFRFAVDDSVDVFPGGTGANHEVSAWIPIDWVGWRLVEWDLENDPVGSWLGNGVLEGQMRFDSFQLQYRPDTSAASGAINIDLLQVAVDAITSVETVAGTMPGEFQLHQNYPNPFNPETRIVFDLAEAGDVRLEVIDILGRTVRTLASDFSTPGRYTVTWNGRDDDGRALPSGIYFSRLIQGHQQQIRKMMLLK
jgi:N-acetylmuramoyl-L-alanine amidase